MSKDLGRARGALSFARQQLESVLYSNRLRIQYRIISQFSWAFIHAAYKTLECPHNQQLGRLRSCPGAAGS